MRTMTSAFVLSSLLVLQGVWCAPADTNTVTPGNKLSEDFNKNLALVLSNLHNSVSGVVNPSIKLGVDTIPSVVTYGINTAADKAAKLVNANQEAFGNIAVGASHALGGGAVLGSSIAGGAMKVAGQGLEVANNLVGAGAKVGVDLAGKVADHTAGAAQLVGTVANNALTGLGDGMVAFGSGADLLSKNLANVIDTIGGRLALQMSAAKDMVAKLMDSGAARVSNGVLTFSTTAQTNLYNMLISYMNMMMNMQKTFDSIITSMNSMELVVGINPNTGAGATGTAATGVGSAAGAVAIGKASSGGAASGTRRAEASAAASVGIARPGASQKS